MTAKSPTASLKFREKIGEDLFNQRREVFDKYDTVFMPQSPTVLTPTMEVEPIITSNHGKTTSNFNRTNAYSSMRETRRDDFRQENGFRNRKYSDNFTSDLNQNDEVDYRHSLAERTRRLSKLRRDFLASNLHDPVSPDPFARTGTRSSLPVRNGSINYKIEIPNLYKFPFAEPYSTPPPVRRVFVDLGPVDKEGNDAEKENADPEDTPKHRSLPNNEEETKVDHHKLFDELVKRYSPQRKPIDWTLPPTKPRVIGSVPKSRSNSIDSKQDENEFSTTELPELHIDEDKPEKTNEDKNEVKSSADRPSKSVVDGSTSDSKVSLAELEERKDKVADLALIQRQLSREAAAKRLNIESKPDPTIPDLIEKMNHDVERKSKTGKKVKRKRSFLDKILGRKKEK